MQSRIETKTEIAKTISELRKTNGLTQDELAKIIGIKRVLLSDYERGKITISGEMIARIAKALHVSSDLLLGLEKPKSENASRLKIMKRMVKIEKLPPAQQKIILRNIDIDLVGLEHQMTTH
jgi:transcriptional regulator with XRE-family HTH domain